MQEPMLLKSELLTRLTRIYHQLEKLEDVLHSSFIHQQETIEKMQKDRINQCSKRLSILEQEVIKYAEDKNLRKQTKISPSPKKSVTIPLELSFKSS
jgi:hypothetical protein